MCSVFMNDSTNGRLIATTPLDLTMLIYHTYTLDLYLKVIASRDPFPLSWSWRSGSGLRDFTLLCSDALAISIELHYGRWKLCSCQQSFPCSRVQTRVVKILLKLPFCECILRMYLGITKLLVYID